MLSGGRRIFFQGCPLRHPSELWRWADSYDLLKRFGKTPWEMGLLRRRDLDPRWHDAMLVIDREVMKPRPRPGGSHGAR